MISEIKYVQDFAEEEDELSTNIGSSDSELSNTSGDDEPPSPSAPAAAAATAQQTDDLRKNVVWLVLCILIQFRTFLLTSLLGKAQQPTNAPVIYGIPKRPKSEVWNTTKDTTQRQPFRPPPGLNLPSCEAKVQRLVELPVGPPPGLTVKRHEAPHDPPGLSVHSEADVQCMPMKVPPGLEGFSPPPGIFFSQNRKEARHSRRSAVPTAAQAQPVSLRSRKTTLIAAGPKELVSTKLPTLPAETLPSATPREFDQAIYRRELSDVLRDLAGGTNVAAAVRRIRTQNVPRERQAPEFRDILTRAVEENRGVVRRLSFAFAGGLAAGEPSAFGREECLSGIKLFFEDVFEDLASDVPRLRSKVANELVPTLCMVFSEAEVGRLLPPDCRSVMR